MSEQSTPVQPEREDYRQALQSLDTLVDVSIDDLLILNRRARTFAEQRHTAGLRVEAVMTRPVQCVSPDTPLAEAAHRMVEERISGLPVVDDRERLVGIITEADLLRALGVPAHHPSHTLWQTLETLLGQLAHPAAAPLEDRVAGHMVGEVVTVGPGQGLSEVITLMKRHRVKRVVVCDDGRRVLGMVTRSNLVRLFFDRYTAARGA